MATLEARIMAEVLAARDHYAVLGVTREMSVEELKRAYKKRALLLHPDKNKLPRAEEAFKKVGAAHTTLSDPEKRRVYDRYGEEGVQAHESGNSPQAAARAAGFNRAGGGRAHYQQQHAGEEIFDMFDLLFGGGPRRRRPQYAQQHQHQQHQQQQQRQHQGGGEGPEMGVGVFMLIPILLFIAMNFVLSFGSGGGSSTTGSSWGSRSSNSIESHFSLTRDTRNGFTSLRTVHTIPEIGDVTIPYYVRSGFDDLLRRNGMNPRTVEMVVARAHRDSLGRRCQAELQRTAKLRKRERPEECREYDRMRAMPDY
jgi:curved DNA-binding protein CbpA